MLILGDVAYEDGTLEQFEHNVFDVYQDLFRSFPVFPISGNHEYETADAAAFREVFVLPENGGPAGVERWYSYDWGPIHFVALDTELVNAEQQAWLDADLAATTQPWKVVYLHKPPFSSGVHGSDLAVRDRFVPTFVRHGVQLVLAGHDHDYERTDVLDGITYVVSGGGGRGTRGVGSSSWTAFSVEVLHFLLVRTQGERMLVHAIDATGREFDSTVIPLR
jgi:3',5'-cyclic AMP phosphodiesterase CpdA